MSDWWTTSTGKPLSGKADDAFTGTFKIIPDGTQAPASIKAFELKSFPGSPEIIQITWKLMDGEFKGQEVRQKIAINDAKAEKADRAKNMLKLIFNLCEHRPGHTGAPTDADFLPMKGKILAIKIQEFSMVSADGKLIEGNWVSEVHAPSALETVSGVKMESVVSDPVRSAFENYPRGTAPEIKDDIPF